MVEDTKRTKIILCVLGIVPVVWLALLIAPNIDGGLVGGASLKPDEFSKIVNYQ